MRELSVRDLNRALLARQLLLERRRLPVVRAVERLCALQAQYPPSPYVALWSRLEGFSREQLTRALHRRTVLKGTLVHTTLHLVSRSDYPWVAAAHCHDKARDAERRGFDVEAVRAAVPDEPQTAREVNAVISRLIGSDDRWDVSFASRALPWLPVPPSGTWGFHGSGLFELWRDPLPPPEEGTARLVRSFLAAFGPASRQDVAHFTNLSYGQLDPALEDLRRLQADDGRVLLDLPRRPLPAADTPAPVRFVPAFDSVILAHRDRTRIIPAEYHEAVIRRENAFTIPTFLVDGFVAGSWRIERSRTGAALVLEPFERLPRDARRALADEGERLIRFHEPDAHTYRVRG